jgi:hypothetical protein
MWSTVIFQVASIFFIYFCSIEILKTFYIMRKILMTKSQKSVSWNYHREVKFFRISSRLTQDLIVFYNIQLSLILFWLHCNSLVYIHSHSFSCKGRYRFLCNILTYMYKTILHNLQNQKWILILQYVHIKNKINCQ